MTYDQNLYKGKVLRHVDGDTTVVEIDPGFDLSIRKTVRWAEIDAPELGSSEGQAAKLYVEDILPVGSIVYLQTKKSSRDRYGRYLGYFYDAKTEQFGKDVSLNYQMVDAGHAAWYQGKGQ
jgi:endonuclease YncB( thermonuclease family)